MATPVTYNGVSYSIPAFGDVGYAQGPGNLSSYLIALASGPQTTGGLFSLTAPLNFGPNFGIVAVNYTSTTANPATAGQIRLAKTDTIDWRNNANTLNLPLGINVSDQLTFNGTVIGLVGGSVTSVSGTANQINSTGGTTPVLSLSSTLIVPGTFAIPAVTNQIVLGTTNTVTLTAPGPAASRVYTIPDVGGAASFVMTAGAQSIAGVKTFTGGAGAITLSASTIAMGANKITGLAAASATGDALRFEQLIPALTRYRRPVLQFGSVTTVAVEAGISTGTAGDVTILFPDGDLRTVNNTTLSTFNITRNAVLVTAGAQSGLTGATSEATNTWYAMYAVKVTDSATLWVSVGSTVLPLVANFATLNTAYGTNGWVPLGMFRNGDNSAATGDILNFTMNGNRTYFTNTAVGATNNLTGLLLATTASAASLTYTYASGTGAAQIPANLSIVTYQVGINPGTTVSLFANAGGARPWFQVPGAIRVFLRAEVAATEGVLISNSISVALDILLAGFVDSTLGVGPNPLM